MAGVRLRDPHDIGLIVRANCAIGEELPGNDRPIFAGSVEQVVDDVHQCAEINADEVFIDVQYSPDMGSFDTYLEYLDEFAQLTG